MNKHQRHRIGKEKAIELYSNGWWKNKTAREIVQFQLFVEELCLPFEVFHEAITDALKRPVYTHEFGLCYDELVDEFLGNKPAPSIYEIMAVIPKDKLLILER